MKKVIENNYLIKVDDLKSVDKIYYFLINNQYYFFVPCLFSEEEINSKITLLIEFKNNKKFHQLLPNIYGKYLTNGYVLMRIQGCLDIEYGVEDIIHFSNEFSLNSKNYITWDVLWSEKIDYFEYQVSEKAYEKKGIIESFSYFVGLAENAITYLDKVKSLFPKMNINSFKLCHRRVLYPNYKLNFYNPLALEIDLKIRDFCEYIKSKFFVCYEEVWKDIDLYFAKENLDSFLCHMFYGRMLFPSYYFDAYEMVINNEAEESILEKYIINIDKYKDFLRQLKKYLDNYTQIFDVYWLNN